MFTGDRSGEFLYRALWEAGFANQPRSETRHDGLKLRDAYITAAIRCVPPDNKPARDEVMNCRPFLIREMALLSRAQLIVALGGIALDAYLSVLKDEGRISSRAAFKFGHGVEFTTYEGGPRLLASYHPSQQNTSTGRLTAEMLRGIFLRAREILGSAEGDTYTPGGG